MHNLTDQLSVGMVNAVDLGTGIFLSFAFCGSIALFIATKDRWNWFAIARRGASGLLVLLLMIVGLVYGENWLSERPVIQRELWQVQLGSSKDEVMFRKGIPTNKWAGDYWTYQGSNNEPRVSVSFHNSKVDAVFIEQSNAISVNGVFVGTPVEVLEARLGKPSKQIDSDDSRGRTYQYDAFNSIFFLSLGKVTTIGIMDRNAANK